MKLTTINDYVYDLKEKFPEVSQTDLKRILNYCWKMIYLYNSKGLDTLVKDHDIIFYIGKLTSDPLTNFKYYIKKLAKRIRYMFIRTNSEWDGYYYFARTESQYLKYLKENRKKYHVFDNIVCYKLLEECKIKEYNKRYIFRFKNETTNRFIKFYPNLKIKDAELVIQRDPMSMQDLMVSLNKYKYIK